MYTPGANEHRGRLWMNGAVKEVAAPLFSNHESHHKKCNCVSDQRGGVWESLPYLKWNEDSGKRAGSLL